jgi:hypothetical protein
MHRFNLSDQPTYSVPLKTDLGTPKTREARAGGAAWFFLFFAVLWNALFHFVIGWERLKQMGGFRWLFIGAGVLVAWVAIRELINRYQRGVLRLDVAAEPLPAGVPTTATLLWERTPKRPVQALLRVRTTARDQDEPSTAWKQEIDLDVHDGLPAQLRIALPPDVPVTQEEAPQGDKTHVECELLVIAGPTTWEFSLETRRATAQELAHVVPAVPPMVAYAPTAEQLARGRRGVRFAVAGVVGVALVTWLTWFSDFWWPPLRDTVQRLAGRPVFETAINTAPFDLSISNWHDNNWAYQGRLLGRAQIVADENTKRGRLIIDAEDIAVRAFQRCEGQACELAEVSVLLTVEGETSFHTLARSNALAVTHRLQRHAAWRGGPHRFELMLPARLPADAYLKLQVSTAEPRYVYPDGARLQLQRALARAYDTRDPCDDVDEIEDAMRAGCTERARQLAADGPSWSAALSYYAKVALRRFDNWATGHAYVEPMPPLDALLVRAFRLGQPTVAAALLAAGANPNARDQDNPQLTLVGMAAEANEVALLQQLLAAGGDATLRLQNNLGQTVTPLHRALRGDALDAIDILLAAGARPLTDDPTGWTSLHVAAFEGAARSLPPLVRAGAHIDERTPAHRKQTPLMTALQHADLATVQAFVQLGADLRATDAEGKTPCDWARLFKREPAIANLVCRP